METKHNHKWKCSNIPAVFKCVEGKCSAIRIYDYRSKKYTITTKKQLTKKEK